MNRYLLTLAIRRIFGHTGGVFVTEAVLRLEKELHNVPLVRHADFEWISDHDVTVHVVIDPTWETRDRVIDVVDDFARETVDDLTVSLDLLDAEHAANRPVLA